MLGNAEWFIHLHTIIFSVALSASSLATLTHPSLPPGFMHMDLFAFPNLGAHPHKDFCIRFSVHLDWSSHPFIPFHISPGGSFSFFYPPSEVVSQVCCSPHESHVLFCHSTNIVLPCTPPHIIYLCNLRSPMLLFLMAASHTLMV